MAEKGRKKPWWKSQALIAVATVVAVVGGVVVYAVGQREGWFPTDEERCQARGERYYKRNGQWPLYGSGYTIDEVKRRCDLSTDAF